MEDVASAAGFAVSLPDLTTTVTSGDAHRQYVAAVVTEANRYASPITVVGHSGAGAFLPTIGHQTVAEHSLIFVDAALPPPAGAHRTPERMKAMLDAQTEDGVLRMWLSWWDDDTVAELVPDTTDRHRLLADMPRLPRSFYDADINVPSGLSTHACGYLRLSEAYDDAVAEAPSWGWSTARCESTHLGVYTDADRIFSEIANLDEQLR